MAEQDSSMTPGPLTEEDISILHKFWEILGKNSEKLYRFTSFNPSGHGLSENNLRLWRTLTQYKEDISDSIHRLLISENKAEALIYENRIFLLKHGENLTSSPVIEDIMKT